MIQLLEVTMKDKMEDRITYTFFDTETKHTTMNGDTVKEIYKHLSTPAFTFREVWLYKKHYDVKVLVNFSSIQEWQDRHPEHFI